MKFQNYQITLNEEQAKIISKSLDFYSRIIGEQFERIKDLFWGTKSEHFEEIGKVLSRLKYLLIGIEDNSNLGIGNISVEGRNAYDLHQVIRHCLALNRATKPSHWLTVDFNPPTQCADQPLAQIERVNVK
jgi:hypothetical protein